LAQGKLREESHRVNKLENRDSSLLAGRQGLMPQNDIPTQSLSKGGREGILFTEQRKQQGQDDTDQYGSGNRKVASKILFFNDDISRKSAHPRYFLSDQ
jgi:hypothetical protein